MNGGRLRELEGRGDDWCTSARTQDCQPGVGDGKWVACCSAAGSKYSIQSSSLRLSLSLIRLGCGGIVLSADQGGIRGCGGKCLIDLIIHGPPKANQNQKVHIKVIFSAKQYCRLID